PGPDAACRAILSESFAGEEQGNARDRCAHNPSSADHLIEVFNSPVTHRELGIDDVINCDLVSGGSQLQLLLRPFGPSPVAGDQVQRTLVSTRINRYARLALEP